MKTKNDVSKLAKKMQKQNQEYYDRLQTLGTIELKKEINGVAKTMAESIEAKENSEKIKEIRYQLSITEKPFTDQKKACELSIRYIREILAEKGE